MVERAGQARFDELGHAEKVDMFRFYRPGATSKTVSIGRRSGLLLGVRDAEGNRLLRKVED